jgi:hypothetical protein
MMSLFYETQTAGPSKEGPAARRKKGLLQKKHGPAALDLPGNPAMKTRGNSGHTAGQNLAALRHKFAEEFGILVIHRLIIEVDAPPRHHAVGSAEVLSTLCVLGLHNLYLISRWSVCRFKNGLYFFFSSRLGVLGLFLFRVLM